MIEIWGSQGVSAGEGRRNWKGRGWGGGTELIIVHSVAPSPWLPNLHTIHKDFVKSPGGECACVCVYELNTNWISHEGCTYEDRGHVRGSRRQRKLQESQEIWVEVLPSNGSGFCSSNLTASQDCMRMRDNVNKQSTWNQAWHTRCIL